MKKLIIFTLALSLLSGITPLNSNAVDERSSVLLDGNSFETVIIDNDSVLFNYTVDSVSVFTNDTFEDGFEGESYRFYPQAGGKYLVLTGRSDIPFKDLVDETSVFFMIDSSHASLEMQSYIVENFEGTIKVTESYAYSYPPADTDEGISKSIEISKKIRASAESEISSDHYFQFSKVPRILERYPDVYYEDENFCITASAGCKLVETHDYPIGRKISYLWRPEPEFSSENLNRYILLSDLKLDITEPVINHENYQLFKHENDVITVYSVDKINDILVPSSLSIKTYEQGDVNADGEFNISDVVLLQKRLLSAPDTEMLIWQLADLDVDCKLDAYDLCLMKEALIEKFS